MDLVKTQYIEINLIGVVVLITILFYILRIQHDFDRGENKYFKKLLISNIVILLADISIYLMRWHYTKVLFVANHICNILFFMLHSCFGYYWLMYTLTSLYPEYKPSKRMRAIFLLPCFISAVLILSSPWTKCIYYLTNKNRYVRGDYLWLEMLFACIYWVVSAIIAIYEWIKKRRLREKSEYIVLLLFPVPTMIGNLLQTIFYGLSIIWICSAISLMILFINILSYQVSHDILTGIYNRRQADKQLFWEIDHVSSSKYMLFLIILDVDKFKQINDQFGHIVGDQALIRVANILQQSCRPRDFIGRLGGDEFVVIGHADNEEEIKQLVSNINKMVNLFNTTEQATYDLSISMGYEIYNENMDLNIDAILNGADDKMYQQKCSSHNMQRIQSK